MEKCFKYSATEIAHWMKVYYYNSRKRLIPKKAHRMRTSITVASTQTSRILEEAVGDDAK